MKITNNVKKGFTLLELLGIIVLLAVIALVTVPIVLKVTENAKKESAALSAYAYVHTFSNYVATQEISSERLKLSNNRIYKVTDETEYDYTELDYFRENPDFNQTPSEIKLNNIIAVAGSMPTDGYVILGNGTLIEAELIIGDYVVYCDKYKKCVTTGKVLSNNVTSIEIQKPEVTVITAGKTLQLEAIIETTDGAEGSPKWLSSDTNIATVDKNGLVTGVSEGTTTIVASAGRKKARITITVINDSILGYVSNPNLKDNTYIDITSNGITYKAHLYVYDGDTVFSENKTFGDAKDVATATTYAQNMVIVKVNGDLTINSGVTVSPYHNTYGGPKGFLIYVTGKLINNGTINNSYGAYAKGENVYLWKNTDGTYEYIPATGAAGGAGVQSNAGYCTCSNKAGKTGGAGSNRGTAGGGSGNGYTCCNQYIVKKGGTGTSYSGGAGSGAAYACTSGDVTAYGAKGGTSCGNNTSAGASTTGGLLIIYSDSYENKGSIIAKGSSPTSATYAGGASGGGSINIFTNQPTNINQLGIITNTKYNEMKGTTNVAGGTKVASGGTGGTGTVNIGGIRNGQYYDLKAIIEQDKAAYIESVTKSGDSILSIVSNDIETAGYWNLKANNVVYPAHVYVYDGDTIFSENQIFGDSKDVATATTYAQNMVIVKVNGDLTINSGVTVSPYHNTYGGPKGFLIYVTGKLINNGTINNSYGAYAQGENVYLWKNADGTYEYVPALGAAGGAGVQSNAGYCTCSNKAGKTGGTGSNRGTAGGGSGNGYTCCDQYIVKKGGQGTSYSGGAGSGAAYACEAGDVSAYGTKGGTSCGNNTSAGAGIAGGLLIIYSDSYENNGSITAKGSSPTTATYAGGASGGGSINVFTNNEISLNKTVSAAGGTKINNGGTGGTGSITIGNISTGTFVKNN